MRQMILTWVMACLLAGAAVVWQPSSARATEETGLPSKTEVQSFLKHWFGYDPTITLEVGEISKSEIPGVAQVVVMMGNGQNRKNMVLYVMPGEQYAIVGEVIPFGADPFAHDRALLAKSTTGIARGPSNAAVSIVEFSDLECPHCKAAQPTVDRLLADFPNARFVFQQFPLEAVHPWAMKAAEWADCIGQQNNQAFWKFLQGVYDDQLTIDMQNVDAKLREHAAAAGANADGAAACAATPKTYHRVQQSILLGKTVGVNGTPTLFIEGRKISAVTSMPYDTLKSLVAWAEKDK